MRYFIRPGFGFKVRRNGILAFDRAPDGAAIEIVDVSPAVRGIHYGKRADNGQSVAVDQRGITEQA